MGFFKSFLFAVTLLASVASAKPSRDRVIRSRNAGGGVCKSERFTPTTYVGAKTKTFCESAYGTTGQMIYNFTMWSTPDSVVGIQGVYSGFSADPELTTPVYGRQTDHSVSLSVNNNEGIFWSNTELWTGASDKSVRTVNLTNNIGDMLFVGEEAPGQHGLTGHKQPIGGGIIYGFSGSTIKNGQGEELNGLRFLFAYSS